MDSEAIRRVVGASPDELTKAIEAGALSVDNWNGLQLFAYAETSGQLRTHARASEAARGLVLDSNASSAHIWPVRALPLTGFRDASYLQNAQADVQDITTKLDGALAISFPWGETIRWTGRSSFSSVVANLANEMWNERYRQVVVPSELTLCAEVIHPNTNVLIGYDFADLVLVGARNRFTGDDLAYDDLQLLAERLCMRIVPRHNISLNSALTSVNQFQTECEGYVVRLRNGLRVKLASPLYNAIYDLRKRCTRWMITELWSDGWEIQNLRPFLPAEVRVHVELTMTQLASGFLALRKSNADADRAQTVAAYRDAMSSSLHTVLSETLPHDV